MFIQEKVHGLIPFSIELLIGCRIPPILIEFPVGELGNFRKNIRNWLKHDVKHQDQQESAGEHASKNQLHMPIFMPWFDDRNQVLCVNNIGHEDADNSDDAFL